MTVPKPTDDETNSSNSPSAPETPTDQAATPNATSTETKDGDTAEPTVEGSPTKPPATPRRRAATVKQPPSLLTDFLLGRQSPARIAADKQAAREALKRRKSLEQIKVEMREAAVQRVQAPGGVRDRVTKWQKANAAAMAAADPLATPTEPSEVNIQVENDSVTEEDRVRIKMRQKKKVPVRVVQGDKHTEGEEGAAKEPERCVSASPPKKRVVSDTNWVKKQNKKSPPRKPSPKVTQTTGTGAGTPLPKGFLARPTPNQPVSQKIQNWASKVELPDHPPKRHSTPRSVGASFVESDGIRVKPMVSESDLTSAISGRTQSTGALESQKSTTITDDGIRVRPLRTKREPDDGIRVRPMKTTLPDDGIRVRPSRPTSREASTVRASSRQTSKITGTETTDSYLTGTSRDRSPSPLRLTGASRDRSPLVQTTKEAVPPKSRKPKRSVTPPRPKRRSSGSRKRRALSQAETGTTMTEDVSDSESWTSGSDVESDIPSTLPPKSLAEIPFGFSAFSELDLATGQGRPSMKKPKTKRQPSFKGATHVLKKALNEALNEGKKMLADKGEPPKPVGNQPPNIEKWLNHTVDPFVEGQEASTQEPQIKSVEKEWAEESKTRRSASSAHEESAIIVEYEPSSTVSAESKPGSKSPREETKTEGSSTLPASSLKRSRATRTISSPLKTNVKRGFKEKLLDAFRGESAPHPPPPLEYSSYEKVIDDESERTTDYYERSADTRRSRSSYDDDDYSSVSDSSISADPAKPKASSSYPKRRAPPTNGRHELSTILSDADTLSTLESDLTSVVSDSTITETTMTRSTGLTRSSAVSRRRSQKSGLKRRLTKHSDLVSALSLPDETAVPSRSRSLRSTGSVRRASNHLREATVEGLLQEFVHDENLYSRELKTLVDGVIPVLLSQFVHRRGETANDLFDSSKASSKEDPLPKAVVNMGIALERLKKHHRRCPLIDIHKLPQWLEIVTPVYENYLNVWRLGFQGIIVNLAPATPDDEDSLIGALPRNEEGDVLNEDGDRIDVAHLLKRPLVRIKWITKFIQGYRTVTQTTQYETLAKKWEALQERARKRHKEEVARIVDDNAKNTDPSLARDLRTMGPLDNARIDRYRQVYAKDQFSLDLQHSNGQRLECQVELVFRDNQLFKSDPGDLLIRETGDGGRSWLLFAPITGNHLSARQGDDKHQMIVMIRGYKDEWFELITLTTDSEEQVQDWLDILGSSPMPPAIRDTVSAGKRRVVAPPSSMSTDRPLGERKRSSDRKSLSVTLSSEKEHQIKPKAPTRYHQRQPSLPASPAPATHHPTSPTSSSGKTATQDTYMGSQRLASASHTYDAAEQRSRPLKEHTRPEPLSLKTSTSDSTEDREDGAPPPPAHRTLSTKKSPTLAPPIDDLAGLKRRGSSPLKHEYYPSDISSESSFTSSESENDDYYSDESSDDELEATDMPDAAPAISIMNGIDDDEDESVISLAPSVLPSKAEIPQATGKGPDYLFQSLATISYWDNKHGCWKDLWPDICSVVTTPGLIEAFPYRRNHTSSGEASQEEDRPLIALDLTPLVMLRNSTALDLEIRSPVLNYARLYPKVAKAESSFFRFRAPSFQDCESLYMAVHRARLDNAKYKALEEETRIRAFGQKQTAEPDADGNSQRRSWFGRKNSYRASARAPSQSAGSTSPSSASTSSFLKRLMGGGGQFNIAMSSVDRQSRFGSGENSLYTSSSSGAPRSPSVSAANSGNTMKMSLTTNNIKIRLHLLISASKWEDHGNCYLEVTRPDSGTRQNLRKYQGMEKRIIVTSIPKKDEAKRRVILDVVLGSRCFSRLGSRGILLNVWEEVRNESGEMGVAPKGGGSGGNVNKWCIQCASVVEASWIYGLVTQEVVIV
ncbi:hypothetical protein GGR57DRAFT_504570 [Xylariaceae sp. FL1272]|nr:hypothetical protein GGR57DRAFT_504570 [Xylariaceae sp. FL1272]